MQRLFGFSHRRDEILFWSVLQRVWPALGMGAFGDFADVDSGAPPYGGSHMLSSNLGSALSYHSATVADGLTPLDAAGLPIYRRVWQVACFL